MVPFDVYSEFTVRVPVFANHALKMSDFYYSPHYHDDKYEYRHVIIPKEMVSQLPQDRLLTEEEWRNLGVQQSIGWVHFMVHNPERHVFSSRQILELHVIQIWAHYRGTRKITFSKVLLFRRPLKREDDYPLQRKDDFPAKQGDNYPLNRGDDGDKPP